MRTGDVGYMDEDGYVYLVDRTKDMLLCGGFNVYPRVLEEAIYKHPGGEEVAVVGIRDEYRGQSPKAFIKLKDGAAKFTLDELQKFLKDKLGKHEMVQALEIRDALPKTPVGKISKKDLNDQAERKTAAHEYSGFRRHECTPLSRVGFDATADQACRAQWQLRADTQSFREARPLPREGAGRPGRRADSACLLARTGLRARNQLAALGRQSHSNQVSNDSLRKTGIFAGLAGDFR
jgi:hypothetical protein